MDIAGAFDHVNHERLLHDLRIRRIPEFIVHWIASFLSDRVATVKLGNYISEKLDVQAGIPQGSVLSSILFLFFGAELLEICQQSKVTVSGLGFVDDTSVLA